MSNIYDAYDRRISSLWQSKVYDENGNEVTSDDPVMRDGHHQRVPLVLMDGKTDTVKDLPAVGSKFAPITDAERERRQQAIADYNARISCAWKNPPAIGGD